MKTLLASLCLISALLFASAVHAQTPLPPGYGYGFYGSPLPGSMPLPFTNPFVRSAYAAELYYQDAMLATEEAAQSRRTREVREFEKELDRDDEAAAATAADMSFMLWDIQRMLNGQRERERERNAKARR